MNTSDHCAEMEPEFTETQKSENAEREEPQGVQTDLSGPIFGGNCEIKGLLELEQTLINQEDPISGPENQGENLKNQENSGKSQKIMQESLENDLINPENVHGNFTNLPEKHQNSENIELFLEKHPETLENLVPNPPASQALAFPGEMPLEASPQKPFSFLEYIKKPPRSDERRTELQDLVSQINEQGNSRPLNRRPLGPRFLSQQELSSPQEGAELSPLNRSLQDTPILPPEERKAPESNKRPGDGEEEEKEACVSEPRFIYGHSLEDIVYNVNNLRGQLNILRQVSENAGIDSTFLQNIDQSFSVALNGIQQRVEERRANPDVGEATQILNSNFPEISEEALLQLIKELQGPGGSPGERRDQSLGPESPPNRGSPGPLRELWGRTKEVVGFVSVHGKSFCLKAYNTFRNPDNLFKLMILTVSIVFSSGVKQIPALEKYDGEFFDWLAYNKSSKTLLFVRIESGSLIFVLIIGLLFKSLWEKFVGVLNADERSKLANYLMDFSSMIHLGIIYMADSDIISNKLDLTIWVCVFAVYTILNAFLQMASKRLKFILSNTQYSSIEADNAKIWGIHSMLLAIYTFDLATIILGIYLFYYSSIYILSLLFFEGILVFIESLKNILTIRTINGNLTFYLDNNCDQIKDPFFFTEISFETVYNLLKIAHYTQLTVTYFQNSVYPSLFQLWLLYLFREIQSSVSQIKRNYDNLITFQNILQNLNSEFPLVEKQPELHEEEMCSICHDSLNVARKLKCNHKFHIKCLFFWLKTQQNTSCPICRSEIPNITFLRHQKRSWLYRVISIIANLTDLNVRFVTRRMNQEGNPENPANPNNNAF